MDKPKVTPRPRAPRGWRLLRKGEYIRKGDRFLCLDGSWAETCLILGDRTQVGSICHSYPYARKVARRARNAKRRGR